MRTLGPRPFKPLSICERPSAPGLEFLVDIAEVVPLVLGPRDGSELTCEDGVDHGKGQLLRGAVLPVMIECHVGSVSFREYSARVERS